VGHLGELEQLILFAVTALGDDAYGGAIRAYIEERSGRIVSSGAISTTLGRLAERRLVVGRVGTPLPGRAGRPRKYYALTPTYWGSRELTPRRSRIGRLLAALFIRGAEVPFIPCDLECPSTTTWHAAGVRRPAPP
jgi:DNA-binding PadR family transcriptional regulator